ncbi:hypothetical protein CPB84DRAFT_1795973 [Gymnopilus junonius]|uniref:F-box domain-containing protein n=1 Tax=Gymnopilus junonius TaxID=109634 RepID=A0A9P5NBE8_GYMJU|nr:hypothetical protein CPB84DRAFT_1795973 [Gymnopilus junonius]
MSGNPLFSYLTGLTRLIPTLCFKLFTINSQVSSMLLDFQRELPICTFCTDSHGHKHDVPCPMTTGELCAPCTKLKQLEAQIQETKKALDNLLEQHRETRSHSNRAHDPIIHRLPMEIASLIFQFCLPVIPPDGILAIPYREMASPLILGAVCRYWRNVAWATPQLWSVVPISVSRSRRNARVILDLAREWLGRSGRLPLSIGLYADDDLKFCELVNEYSTRWHMLDLHVSLSMFSHFQGSWEKSSPLQSLHLSALYGYYPPDLIPQELVLRGGSPKAIEIEWSRLTSITLTRAIPGDCLDILKLCPQLKHYKIELNEPFAPEDDIVIHNQLEHLELEENCFNFPSQQISYFLTRSSSPPLKQLSIDFVNMDQEAVISLLRTLSSLERLKIQSNKDRAPSPDALLRLLAATSSTDGPPGQDFLPILRYFSYSRPSSYTGFSWSLVTNIFGRLSSLQDPHRRPLEEVNLSFGKDHYEKWEPRSYINQKSLSRFFTLLNHGRKLYF